MHSPSLEQRLAVVFSNAAQNAFGDQAAGFDPTVRESKFADYQVNGGLALAKSLNRPPREVAQELVDALDAEGKSMLSLIEVAGPGFINCTFADEYLSGALSELASNDSLGITPSEPAHTYVIDYSSPNIAKSMHVGHLRTTIIGDAFARMVDAKGDRLIRQNHLGDWGTQFGMLIQYLEELDEAERASAIEATVSDLDALYRQARAKFDADEDFQDRSRSRVVALQSGDEHTYDLWQQIVKVSEVYFDRVYARLNVTLTDDDYRGESFYNDQLDDTVNELESLGLLSTSEGALCAFPTGFAGHEGEPLPVIVRKSDGGYGYAATDLAAVRFRTRVLQADRILYVTDARQAQHFAMVFAVAREAGWIGENVEVTHVPYGMVLGTDGKPFKTRSGEVVQLSALLDEAIERAEQAISERGMDGTPEERAAIAEAVGIGALKWADLSNQRSQNYVFDWDRMLSFAGDTGPYVQYAATRARSVLRKAGVASDIKGPFAIAEPSEHALAVKLSELGSTVDRALALYEPHHLATFLYDVADRFTTFYDKCPVLKADDDDVRNARLALCALTARVLSRGLDLLGIKSLERM